MSVCASSVVAGVIIRNSIRDVIKSRAFNIGSTKVFVAEVVALHHGIRLTINEGIQHLVIEGGNLLVINAIKDIFPLANCQYLKKHPYPPQLLHQLEHRSIYKQIQLRIKLLT